MSSGSVPTITAQPGSRSTFGSWRCPINTTVDLPTRPQLPFRPERLFVQSDMAGNFEIVDIIIGDRSQVAQATPMSARIAAETSFGFDLHRDTAMVAMDVVLRIATLRARRAIFARPLPARPLSPDGRGLQGRVAYGAELARERLIETRSGAAG
jgi:hypothetical protein